MTVYEGYFSKIEFVSRSHLGDHPWARNIKGQWKIGSRLPMEKNKYMAVTNATSQAREHE